MNRVRSYISRIQGETYYTRRNAMKRFRRLSIPELQQEVGEVAIVGQWTRERCTIELEERYDAR